MESRLVQGQWSLNETSDSVYSIARGVLQAATSDNVQPLAIMACEQFGNTLAISRETRLKIERTVLPTPEPVTIRFLKVKVGFMKHDCAVQLGSNQAGLRFLALAAALISSVSAYHCADALMLMLESTTSDKRLLPTTRHLADLMSSLESRCRLVGFADIVYGYGSIIQGATIAKGNYPECSLTTSIPDSEGLASLVDAFRHLQRVGDCEISCIIVEARNCAAWVAAFSKWSLELPPSICFADGTPIISQPGSQFTIMISVENDHLEHNIKVTKRFKFNSIQDLIVQSSSHHNNTYRVSLKTYGNLIQETFRDQKDAVFAALPLAIKLVCEKDRLPSGGTALGLEGVQPFIISRPTMFSSTTVIFNIMSRLFNLLPDFPFDSLASAKSFRHLPEVEHYLMGTSRTPGNYNSDRIMAPWWKKDLGEPHQPNSTVIALSEYLSSVCYHLFLVSLFDNIEDLHLIPPRNIDRSCEGYSLYGKIFSTLIFGTSFGPPEYEQMWLDVDKLLVVRPREHNTLVSSTRTHVFWYSILDDLIPKSTGKFRITYSRGRLMYERQLYHNVFWGDSNDSRHTIIEEKRLDSAARNCFPDGRVQWQLTARLGSLYAYLTLISRREPRTIYGYYRPTSTMRILAGSSLLVNCTHPTDTPIKEHKPSWVFHAPGERFGAMPNNIHIFPVGGVGELQIYCLQSIYQMIGNDKETADVVIRERACFDCCIKVCEALDSRFLIL